MVEVKPHCFCFHIFRKLRSTYPKGVGQYDLADLVSILLFSLLITLVSLLARGCLRSAFRLMIGKYSEVFAVRHVLVNCQNGTCSVKIMTGTTTIDFRSFRQWLQTLQAAYYEGTLMDRFSMRASMARCL